MSLLYGAPFHSEEKGVDLNVTEIPAANFQSFALANSNATIEHWIQPSLVKGKIDAVIWQYTLHNTGATAIVPSTAVHLASRHDIYFNGTNSGAGLQIIRPEAQLANLGLIRQEKLQSIIERAGMNPATYLEDTSNAIAAGATATRVLNMWDFSSVVGMYPFALQSAVVHKATLRANPQVTGSAVDGKLSITDSRLIVFWRKNKKIDKELATWKSGPVTVRFSEPNTFIQTNCKLTTAGWTDITLNNITGHVTACALVVRPLAGVNTAAGARSYSRMELDKYDSKAAFDITDGTGKSVFGTGNRGVLFNELTHIMTAKNLPSSFANNYPGWYLIPFGNSLNETLMSGAAEGGIHMDGNYRLRILPTNAACDGATDFQVELICFQPYCLIKDSKGHVTSKKVL